MKQKNEALKVLSDFFISLFVIAFFIWILFFCYTFISVWHDCNEMSQPSQQEFLRVRIFGNSTSNDGNTISAEISIIDTNGNEVAGIERSWMGNYLGVEFSEVEFNKKFFLFPTKVFGKDRIMETKPLTNKGTSLDKYYNENNQCMLLGFSSTYEERNKLYRIARFAAGKYLFPGFGHISSYSLDLSSCKMNTWYSIQRTEDGNLVILEI